MGASVDDLFDANLDGPALIQRARAGRHHRSLWLGVSVPILALAMLVAGCWSGLVERLIAGFPATPMTVERADGIFGKGTRPGQSRAAVEAWLASQGIAPDSRDIDPDRTISYLVIDRSDDDRFWLDSRDDKTVAECAGLDRDEVHSVIRVIYPDADRHLISRIEVRVYLFFDRKGLLLRHWVDMFVYTL